MLTRVERKARHLTTAIHMRNVFPDEGAEVIEVIAAHLHDAYKAAGDDPDSDELRARAKDAYVQAGDRAEAVGAPGAAETAYLTAVELSSDDEERARFIEKSAEMAMRIGADDRALNGFEKAAASHLLAGRIVDAARVTAWIGRCSSGPAGPSRRSPASATRSRLSTLLLLPPRSSPDWRSDWEGPSCSWVAARTARNRSNGH